MKVVLEWVQIGMGRRVRGGAWRVAHQLMESSKEDVRKHHYVEGGGNRDGESRATDRPRSEERHAGLCLPCECLGS